MSARRPLTRGPLPPEVYWRRRFFVITLALTLVFVIGSVLTGGSDGEDDEPAAQQAAVADPTRTVTVTPGAGDQPRRKGRRARNGTASPRAPETTPLAEPDGPCEPADIVLTPVVEDAVAGRDVTIGLSLQTGEADACTWRVSNRSVAVKVVDGTTEVWTNRECPAVMPSEPVVVRSAVATVVEMTWVEARESDTECSNQRDWAMAGDYTVLASAIGGEPAETTFDLASPTARTVTVQPKPSASPKAQDSGTAKPDRSPSRDAAAPRTTSTARPTR